MKYKTYKYKLYEQQLTSENQLFLAEKLLHSDKPISFEFNVDAENIKENFSISIDYQDTRSYFSTPSGPRTYGNPKDIFIAGNLNAALAYLNQLLKTALERQLELPKDRYLNFSNRTVTLNHVGVVNLLDITKLISVPERKSSIDYLELNEAINSSLAKVSNYFSNHPDEESNHSLGVKLSLDKSSIGDEGYDYLQRFNQEKRLSSLEIDFGTSHMTTDMARKLVKAILVTDNEEGVTLKFNFFHCTFEPEAIKILATLVQVKWDPYYKKIKFIFNSNIDPTLIEPLVVAFGEDAFMSTLIEFTSELNPEYRAKTDLLSLQRENDTYSVQVYGNKPILFTQTINYFFAGMATKTTKHQFDIGVYYNSHHNHPNADFLSCDAAQSIATILTSGYISENSKLTLDHITNDKTLPMIGSALTTPTSPKKFHLTYTEKGEEAPATSSFVSKLSEGTIPQELCITPVPVDASAMMVNILVNSFGTLITSQVKLNGLCVDFSRIPYEFHPLQALSQDLERGQRMTDRLSVRLHLGDRYDNKVQTTPSNFLAPSAMNSNWPSHLTFCINRPYAPLFQMLSLKSGPKYFTVEIYKPNNSPSSDHLLRHQDIQPITEMISNAPEGFTFKGIYLPSDMGELVRAIPAALASGAAPKNLTLDDIYFNVISSIEEIAAWWDEVANSVATGKTPENCKIEFTSLRPWGRTASAALEWREKMINALVSVDNLKPFALIVHEKKEHSGTTKFDFLIEILNHPECPETFSLIYNGQTYSRKIMMDYQQTVQDTGVSSVNMHASKKRDQAAESLEKTNKYRNYPAV